MIVYDERDKPGDNWTGSVKLNVRGEEGRIGGSYNNDNQIFRERK